MNRRSMLVAAALGLPVSSAVAQGTPTAKDNLATVRGFLADVLYGFDAEAARQYISPEYTSPSGNAAPGVDAYIQRLGGYVALMTHTFTEYHLEETAHIARGTVVVIRGHARGATTTGRVVDIDCVYWFDLADGRITQFVGGPDGQQMTEQIYG